MVHKISPSFVVSSAFGRLPAIFVCTDGIIVLGIPQW